MHLWQLTDWTRGHVTRPIRRFLIARFGRRHESFREGQLQLDDLGSPLEALTIATGAATALPEGTPVVCAAPMGENAALNVCRVAEDTSPVGRYPTVATSGIVSMATAADGSVLLGSYPLGHVFRWRPGATTVDDLGAAGNRCDFVYGLSATTDGQVFGGTYPHASYFRWTAEHGITELGRLRGVDYVRATAVDEPRNVLWLGTMPTPQLWTHDLATGHTQQVALDTPLAASGVMALTVVGGLVLAQVSNTLRVLDAVTHAAVRLTDAGTQKPADETTVTSTCFLTDVHGRAWCTVRVGVDTTHRLAVIDPTARTILLTQGVAAGGALLGGGPVAGDEGGRMVALAGNYGGGGVTWVATDEGDATDVQQMHWPLSPAPAALAHVLTDPDHPRAFVSAYVNGSTSVVDLTTGAAADTARLGQVESWTMVDGSVWSGSYPDGAIRRFDPGAAVDATNPVQVATLKTLCAQIRPVGVARLDDHLWWVAVPDYGQRGGALVRVGLSDRSVQHWRPLVPDHSLSAIAVHGGRLLVGTSRMDGTTSLGVGGSAHIVVVDPATAAVQATWTPVRGAHSVTALTPAEDGSLLYALVDDTLVVLDAATGRVLRKRWLDVVGTDVPGSGSIVLSGGAVHVGVGRVLVELDAATLTERSRSTQASQRLVRAADGSLISLVAAPGSLAERGAANPNRVGRWR